jgi:hypothetical protein
MQNIVDHELQRIINWKIASKLSKSINFVDF